MFEWDMEQVFGSAEFMEASMLIPEGVITFGACRLGISRRIDGRPLPLSAGYMKVRAWFDASIRGCQTLRTQALYQCRPRPWPPDR